MLAALIRENPQMGLHPILLLTNKSAELCQLAQMIHEMVRDHRGPSGQRRSARTDGGRVEGKETSRQARCREEACVRESKEGAHALPVELM